jgi:hypothetical protein
MTDRELLQQSLDALSFFNYRGDNDAELFQVEQTIDLLKSRLAEDDDEPVAWMEFDGEGGHDFYMYRGNEGFQKEFLEGNPSSTYRDWVQPLYRCPPQNSESKYKDAIQNCIDMAGGRESEWGPRAESAFAFLYIAIDGGEEE